MLVLVLHDVRNAVTAPEEVIGNATNDDTMRMPVVQSRHNAPAALLRVAAHGSPVHPLKEGDGRRGDEAGLFGDQNGPELGDDGVGGHLGLGC